jgi:hypothetical protein
MSKSNSKFIPAKNAQLNDDSENSNVINNTEEKSNLNLETAKSAFSMFKNEQTGHYFVVEVKYDHKTCDALVTSVVDVGLDKMDAIQTFKIKASDLM